MTAITIGITCMLLFVIGITFLIILILRYIKVDKKSKKRIKPAYNKRI